MLQGISQGKPINISPSKINKGGNLYYITYKNGQRFISKEPSKNSTKNVQIISSNDKILVDDYYNNNSNININESINFRSSKLIIFLMMKIKLLKMELIY